MVVGARQSGVNISETDDLLRSLNSELKGKQRLLFVLTGCMLLVHVFSSAVEIIYDATETEFFPLSRFLLKLPECEDSVHQTLQKEH